MRDRGRAEQGVDGGLFELPGRPSPRYRCRVGHAWSAESLTTAHDDGVDTALWVALRALEEKASLLHRLAADADGRGLPLSAQRHRGRSEDAERDAATLRRVLRGGGAAPAVGGP